MYLKVQKFEYVKCLNFENEYETQIQVQHLQMKMLLKYKK
jgi:hypothetical protein